jgi:hypothetical protein
LLDAEKVIAVRCRLWDCEVDLFLVVRFPVPIFFFFIVVSCDTGNLEPVPVCAVKVLELIIWRTCKVDLGRAAPDDFV